MRRKEEEGERCAIKIWHSGYMIRIFKTPHHPSTSLHSTQKCAYCYFTLHVSASPSRMIYVCRFWHKQPFSNSKATESQSFFFFFLNRAHLKSEDAGEWFATWTQYNTLTQNKALHGKPPVHINFTVEAWDISSPAVKLFKLFAYFLHF